MAFAFRPDVQSEVFLIAHGWPGLQWPGEFALCLQEGAPGRSFGQTFRTRPVKTSEGSHDNSRSDLSRAGRQHVQQ